jgi:ABC-2 type transport system ATP-binding protein
VKKLSLVLGLIGETRLILLDEPLVTLDKETVPILFDLVYKYSALGTYFIFTSHQAFELPSINIQELEVKNQQLLRTT